MLGAKSFGPDEMQHSIIGLWGQKRDRGAQWAQGRDEVAHGRLAPMEELPSCVVASYREA